MADSVKTKIHQAFDKCQERRYNLTKLAETLKKVYDELCGENTMKDEFYSQFLHVVLCLLQDSNRDFATERCMQFAAKFAALFANTSEEEDGSENVEVEDSLYSFLLKFIAQPEYHCHSNKTIRFRICQLIQLLLSAVPRDAALDEDLIDCITKVMLDRIQDKAPLVRCQAARSLSRLQQPGLQNCPVIEAYLFHMACDDNAQVRAAVLSNVSLTTKTLPCVLDRTRDVSETVRKVAFQAIAQKVSIKALTSSQRLYLIKQGLQDRSEAVQKVVKTRLFQAWLLTFSANLLDLLKKLDVVGAYETCCRAVKAMFECSSFNDLIDGFTLLNDNKLMEFDKLTPEASLYWSQLCSFIRSKGADGEQYLDILLPSALTFSEYMDKYFNQILYPFMDLMKNNANGLTPEEEDDRIEKEFVAEQLIKIAVKMDLSDNAGRKGMSEMFERALTEVDVLCFPCLVSPLTCGLLELHNTTSSLEREEEEKISFVAKLISTAREPPLAHPPQHLPSMSEDEMRSCKLEIAKISVRLNELNEELETLVSAKEFVKAGEIQKSIDDDTSKKETLEEEMNVKLLPDEDTSSIPEKSDVGTLIKCLKMVKELLSSLFESRCSSRPRKSTLKGLHPTLLQLLETLLLPSVLNSSSDIRKESIRGVGVACMFSPALSARHFPLLMQVAQADTYIVRVAAINAANDLIRLFGLKNLVANKPKTKIPSGNTSRDQDDVGNDETDDEYNDVDVGVVVMTKFMDMLDDEEVEIRKAVTCLLTRVLVSHRILSPAVVSRLILLWYNPATQDEPSVLSSISNFLNIFPFMSKEAHECIEAAFLPTLRVLFNAPSTSPYASINVGNVAELLVSITRPSVMRQADLKGICDVRKLEWLDEGSAHDNIALIVANEVLSDPHSPYVNTLCKILPILEINTDHEENMKDLTVLCENLLKDVKDKQAIRHIRKFQTQSISSKKGPKDVPLITVGGTNEQEHNDVTNVPTIPNKGPLLSANSESSPLLSQRKAASPREPTSRYSTRSKRATATPIRNLNQALVDADN